MSLNLENWKNNKYFVLLPVAHPILRDVYDKHPVRILCVDLKGGFYLNSQAEVVGAVLHNGDSEIMAYEKLAIWRTDGSFRRIWSLVEPAFELKAGDPKLSLQIELKETNTPYKSFVES
jgi:hypothetical protein